MMSTCRRFEGAQSKNNECKSCRINDYSAQDTISSVKHSKKDAKKDESKKIKH